MLTNLKVQFMAEIEEAEKDDEEVELPHTKNEKRRSSNCKVRCIYLLRNEAKSIRAECKKMNGFRRWQRTLLKRITKRHNPFQRLTPE